MTKALLIPTDTTQPITRTEVHGLEDLQRGVGGWIQPVDGEDFTAYVDEEGKVKGREFNARANRLIHEQVPALPTWDLIVGDVVIVGGLDEEGDSTDVPERVAQLLGLDPAPEA